jgi:hypothetical protein
VAPPGSSPFPHPVLPNCPSTRRKLTRNYAVPGGWRLAGGCSEAREGRAARRCLPTGASTARRPCLSRSLTRLGLQGSSCRKRAAGHAEQLAEAGQQTSSSMQQQCLASGGGKLAVNGQEESREWTAAARRKEKGTSRAILPNIL